MAETLPERMRGSLAVAALLAALLALVTWPYASVITTSVAGSTDSLFSIWRISWFGHAVASGQPIADANIFLPERGTFAFSDSIVLLDILAAPLLWAGVGSTLVYNLLLAAGIVTSGVAVFLALVAAGVAVEAGAIGAVIFTLAPYRLEHIMHLELQWLTGAVAAIAATAALVTRPSVRAAGALALGLVAQFLSCIYYAVFLIPLLGIIWMTAIPWMPHRGKTVRLTLAAGLLAAAVVSPVVRMHVQQSARLGERAMVDVTTFSAVPINYLATPIENWLYGDMTRGIGAGERRLFPGVVATALAAVGLFSRRRRLVWVTLACLAFAYDMSLGTNGWIYPSFYRWVPPWRGLRAAVRYGAFVLLAVSVLAALGWEVVVRRSRRPRLLTAIALVPLIVEYASPQQLLRIGEQPAVYTVLRTLPPGALLEYPTPASDAPTDIEADYQYWSTRHWRAIVNGYSGYIPLSFVGRAKRLEGFPSDDTVEEMRALGVRYVIVHPWAIRSPRRALVLERLSNRPDVRHLGSFADWRETAELFALRP